MTGTGLRGIAPVRTLDELVEGLRALRAEAGEPSYSEIVRRICALRARRGLPEAERVPGRITVYDCFRIGRRRMDPELLSDVVRALGADPAPWLRALRHALAGTAAAAPSPAVAAAGQDPAGTGPPAFAGWPAHCPGRERELALLAGGARGVTVVAGMPGVGKTRLALCAARRMPGRGGRLYAALRGFDPSGPPADPHAVLGALLRGLGVPDGRVSRLTRAERGSLYRRLTAERAAVVVLDDAAGTGQVRELLPGAGARALITSRRDLSGLGAPSLTLAPLAPRDSLKLLAEAAGEERLSAEPVAAARIAEICGQLPLELAVAAEEIARRPGWSLADHVHRLEAAPGSPGLLAALDASYRGLDAPARWVFRLLGLHPAGIITPAGAAALAACSEPVAAGALERLRADHLLSPVRHGDDPRGPGYVLHELVRRHARRLVTADVPYSAQRAAIGRLMRVAADRRP